MPLVIPDVGAPALLLYTLLGGAYGTPGFQVALYINNYAPTYSSDVSSFIEASFPGYARIDLDTAKWLTPTIISHRASSTYDAPGPLTWINTGSAQTIYGYFVYDTATGFLVWAEQFATARVMNTGDELDLTPIFTGGTQM